MLNPNAMLLPLFAMFTLVVIVLLRLAFTRRKAIIGRKISFDYFKTFEGSAGTPEMIVASRQYANLFEAPVLFYVIVILYYVTGRADMTALILSWSYVVLRYVQAIIHLGPNKVRPRFLAFALSQLCLLALWLKLACSLYFRV